MTLAYKKGVWSLFKNVNLRLQISSVENGIFFGQFVSL